MFYTEYLKNVRTYNWKFFSNFKHYPFCYNFINKLLTKNID